MKRSTLSVGRKFALLVLMASLPALVILFFSGMEQRKSALENAQREVLFLVNTMAEVQRDVSRSARQLLSTLSLLPDIRRMDVLSSTRILKTMQAENPEFYNLSLVDLNGIVLASVLPVPASLSDRRHFKEALEGKKFAVGEYIIARADDQTPSFPFAYPVLDEQGRVKAVLAAAMHLSKFASFHTGLSLVEGSFVAVTDHQGIRLLYHPPNEQTNPIGKPILASVWEGVREAREAGTFRSKGSDGVKRIYAYEPVSLLPESSPYLYVWAGVPEDKILLPIYLRLSRNMLIMFLIVGFSGIFFWQVGKRSLILPLGNLIEITRQIGRGDLSGRNKLNRQSGEFTTLAKALYDMADGLLEKEARLAQETERLTVTLKSIGDGVITTDTAGRVVLLNGAAEKLTGWTGSEAEGKLFDEVFKIYDRDTKQKRDDPVKAALASSGGPVELAGNTVLVSRDGQELSIADSCAPIRTRDGGIAGVVLVFRDITRQLRMEKELIRVSTLESVGVLAGGIAHDFNNVLTVILGNIEMALLDSKLSSATETLLRDVYKASGRARDLTTQLLTFAKGGDPVREPVFLGDVIKTAAEFICQGSRVTFNSSLPDDLWQVDVDREQIRLVIQNLIRNARHAMPDGGIIGISCENITADSVPAPGLQTGERFVKMSITHSGAGIPPDLLDKVFDPNFFTDGQISSGLDLTIVQSVVNRHGGRIVVRSTPGEGTTFTVFLPASSGKPVFERTANKAPAEKTVPRILVMDDEEMVRNILHVMLSSLGYEVLLVNEGSEAVDLYKKTLEEGHPVDVILMDLTVPGGMGGKEAARRILETASDAKMVVSSGYSDDPVMANFADYGFAAALKKPFKIRELKEVMARILG